MTRRRLLGAASAAVLVLAMMGCSTLEQAGDPETALPFPAGCAAFDLSERRCAGIVDELAERLGLDRATVRSISLLGDPGCGGDPNTLCARTMSFIVRVRFDTGDGRRLEDSLFCGIESRYSWLCTEEPAFAIIDPVSNGYRDIPCVGEGPEGCATPVPTPAPEAVAAARPLRIDRLDVPIDRVGPYDILLGEAVLPNGVLSETAISLADPTPRGVYADEPAWLDVRSMEDGQRIVSAYLRDWREGTERVEVRLRFDIQAFEPGAVLELRDIVVR